MKYDIDKLTKAVKHLGQFNGILIVAHRILMASVDQLTCLVYECDTS